jgi:DNA-binding CsgD family transcriptional regulator
MDGDYTHGVEYVAEGLRSSVEIVQRRIKEGSLKLTQTTLTPKQEELVALIGKHGVLGAAQICKEMKVNRARVNQLILPLVRSGIIVRAGAARAVRYRLSIK